MIIRELTADFGTLEGRRLSLGPGLNILYAPNGSGKSTWCAFVRTMLYGLRTAEREGHGRLPDKTRYVPWSGRPMAGTLTADIGSDCVTLRRRTIRPGQPMQDFSAVYTGTEEPYPALTALNAGETLTGVTREVFDRSAFIAQGSVTVTQNADLEKRIGSIAASGEEDVSYRDSCHLLRLWLTRRGEHGSVTAPLDAALAETEGRLRALDEAADAAAEAAESLAAAEQLRDAAVRRMERAREQQRRAALDEAARSKTMLSTAIDERDRAALELDERLSALAADPLGQTAPDDAFERMEQLRLRAARLEKEASHIAPVGWTLLPALALVVFLILALAAAVTPWLWLAVAMAPITAFVWLRLRAGQKKKQSLLSDRERLLKAAGADSPEDLDELLDRHDALWEDALRARAALRRATQLADAAQERYHRSRDRIVASLDFSRGDSPAALAQREKELMDERVQSLRTQKAEADGRLRALGDGVVLESELAALQARREAVQAQTEAISLALDTLTAAGSELQSRFIPLLSRRTAELFSRLTGDTWTEVTLTRELRAAVRADGDAVAHEAAFLSAGTADQLYLALRLALCELTLPAADPCPLILDDVLTAFDDERAAAALTLLRELAEERQILLFTCHPRESAFFAGDPSVRCMNA